MVYIEYSNMENYGQSHGIGKQDVKTLKYRELCERCNTLVSVNGENIASLISTALSEIKRINQQRVEDRIEVTPEHISQLPYRCCVGIMLLNGTGDKMFAGQRMDRNQEAWQMP